MSYLNPMHGAHALRAADLVEAVDDAGIDDRGAGASQILDGAHEHLHDLRIGRVALVGLSAARRCARP